MSARKQKADEMSYALGSASARVRQRPSSDGKGFWLDGDVLTVNGIVAVYSQSEAETAYAAYSRYDFVWNGRHYIRSESRSRTERGLAIEAAKFARRVASSRTGGQQA